MSIIGHWHIVCLSQNTLASVATFGNWSNSEDHHTLGPAAPPWVHQGCDVPGGAANEHDHDAVSICAMAVQNRWSLHPMVGHQIVPVLVPRCSKTNMAWLHLGLLLIFFLGLFI